MAAIFSDYGTIASNTGFQSRVYYAAMVAAVNVYAEATNTAGHVQRRALAIAVLNGSFGIAAMAIAVLTNAAIAAEANVATSPPQYAIPDGDIQFAVNSLWNSFAGV